MNTQLLLTYDFPPMGGGIARMMGELARRYTPGTLVVSTGRYQGGPEVDAGLANVVDHTGVVSARLRTLQGLLAWSRRAADWRARFIPSLSGVATSSRPGIRLGGFANGSAHPTAFSSMELTSCSGNAELEGRW
jgi:hypothetical protein